MNLKIYGYPKGVFPPTDFHTVTLVGHKIIVIGCLGNVGGAEPDLLQSIRLIRKAITFRS